MLDCVEALRADRLAARPTSRSSWSTTPRPTAATARSGAVPGRRAPPDRRATSGSRATTWPCGTSTGSTTSPWSTTTPSSSRTGWPRWWPTLEADAGLGRGLPPAWSSPTASCDLADHVAHVPPGPRRRPATWGCGCRGVEVDGRDVWRDAQRVEGFWGLEHGEPATRPSFQWTAGRRRWSGCPVGRGDGDGRRSALRLAAEATKVGHAVRPQDRGRRSAPSPAGSRSCSPGRPTTSSTTSARCWSKAATAPTGASCSADEGQFDEPADVFAWCGGGVLLRSRYLEDVGLFDERFFLYYEDTDLAWRGRARGWRYRYVPESRGPPPPRRQQRRGLGALPALRRAQPPADAGEERPAARWPPGRRGATC